MSQTGPPPQDTTTRLGYALVGGLAPLPVIAPSHWQTGSEPSLGAVLFGGVLAGYLVGRAGDEASGVGVRVGIVGCLPVFWGTFDVLGATSEVAGPAWFVTSATLLASGGTVVAGVLGSEIVVLIGAPGARVGSWLAGNQLGRSASVANY